MKAEPDWSPSSRAPPPFGLRLRAGAQAGWGTSVIRSEEGYVIADTGRPYCSTSPTSFVARPHDQGAPSLTPSTRMSIRTLSVR